MKLKIQTLLPVPASIVWRELQKSETLDFIAAPMVVFNYKTTKPEHWHKGNFEVELKLFGFIPFGSQTISISFPDTVNNKLFLRDNGYSNLISKWDHLISVEPLGENTLYADSLEINAGILTPFIWLFACLFYSHRQKRWVKLTKQLNSLKQII